MSDSTKVLFIRNFPQTLHQKVKIAAATAGVSLTDWVISTIKKALGIKP
jgi:predicted HicB family RNase H-like nuclease